MARRRAYSTDAVVEAAKDAFWRLGYEGTAISDLEAATGLSRSSLYQAFGSKQRLFAASLDAYIRGFITPLLEPLEAPDADPSSVEQFVERTAQLFSEDGPPARYGCLWANSIAGLGRKAGTPIDVRGREYWERLHRGFANALRRGAPPEREGLCPAEYRAHMLAAATFAGWLMVRIDSRRAVQLCDAMLADIASWRGCQYAAVPGRRLNARERGAEAGDART